MTNDKPMKSGLYTSDKIWQRYNVQKYLRNKENSREFIEEIFIKGLECFENE